MFKSSYMLVVPGIVLVLAFLVVPSFDTLLASVFDPGSHLPFP